MFKNNSYSLEACNYSFRQDQPSKQNQPSVLNAGNPPTDSQILSKLSLLQKILTKQHDLQLQNRRILKQQSESIAQIERQISKIYKIIGHGHHSGNGNGSHGNWNNGEGGKNSRVQIQGKSQSMKSCRTKRSVEKSVLSCIEERKKVINQEITRRIGDQLESKPEKKPLRFFMPDQSIL